jgi:NAD-dependent SIR2 family protein deacetylase
MNLNLEAKIRQAAHAVNKADALVITAGAGMGVDSGLPDFRGNQGFWRAYPAIAKLELSFEQMADPRWFTENPQLAWAFYGHRLNLYRDTLPHRGFSELLRIANTKPNDCFVFTSNVDGQFQRAGFASQSIVECHGSIQHWQCVRPCSEDIWEAPSQKISVDDDSFRAREPLPRCRNCGALARPNVLMFDDDAWLASRTDLQTKRFHAWLNELNAKTAKLVVIEVGAGTAIPTVRLTSERMASQAGGQLIRINPRDHDAPVAHIGLPFGAAEGIHQIVACLHAM